MIYPSSHGLVRRVSLQMIRGKSLRAAQYWDRTTDPVPRDHKSCAFPPRSMDMNPGITHIADVEHSTWQ